jgi:hypothetical protein
MERDIWLKALSEDNPERQKKIMADGMKGVTQPITEGAEINVDHETPQAAACHYP